MRFLSSLSLVAWIALPAVVLADGIPLDRLTISGKVQGPNGMGVAGALVSVNGKDDQTLTDASGNYELVIPLHAYGSFKSLTRIRIKVKDDRATYHTATRQSLLAIDLKRESGKGRERCEIRGNETRLVRRIGEAINAGEPELHVRNIHFTEPSGAALRLSMRTKSVVIMGDRKASPVATLPPPAKPSAAGPVAGAAVTPESAPAASPPTPAAPEKVRRVGTEATPVRPAPQTAAKPEVVKLPGPGVTQSDASTIRRLPVTAGPVRPAGEALSLRTVLPGEDGCECRIRGTVELHPDHLLTERLKVFVSLAGFPAVRDTVELFMGSPRSFELRPLRCADWNLSIEAVSKHDFAIVSVDGSQPVECRDGGLRQLRIVLAPR